MDLSVVSVVCAHREITNAYAHAFEKYGSQLAGHQMDTDTHTTHTHIHINAPRLFGCSLVSTVTEDKKRGPGTAGC